MQGERKVRTDPESSKESESHKKERKKNYPILERKRWETLSWTLWLCRHASYNVAPLLQPGTWSFKPRRRIEVRVSSIHSHHWMKNQSQVIHQLDVTSIKWGYDVNDNPIIECHVSPMKANSERVRHKRGDRYCLRWRASILLGGHFWGASTQRVALVQGQPNRSPFL